MKKDDQDREEMNLPEEVTDVEMSGQQARKVPCTVDDNDDTDLPLMIEAEDAVSEDARNEEGTSGDEGVDTIPEYNPQAHEPVMLGGSPQKDKHEVRNEKLNKAMAGAGAKLKQVLATKNGRIGAAVAAVILVVACLFSTHTICFHEWMDATCTDPQICRKCGRSQGEPLGHEWSDPTCTEPETCTRCGETRGEALGHSVEEWKVTKEATCTKRGTEVGACVRCGEEQSRKIDKIDHDFSKWQTVKEASCSEEGKKERTCKACGKKEEKTIAKLDHTPGDWQVIEEVMVTSDGYVLPGTRARVCTVCGAQLETEEFTIDLTIGQKNALKTAASYLSWSGFSYKRLIEQLEFEGFSNEDATFAADHCGADWYEQAEKCAASYMDWASFSRDRLIEQLEYEGFTSDQAQHGADSVGY